VSEVVYVRPSLYSDVEFVAKPPLSLSEGARVKGAVWRGNDNHELVFKRHEAVFTVKKTNEKYTVLRIEEVSESFEEVRVEAKQLYGYKASRPTESSFFKMFGAAPNFSADTAHRDRGLIIAKVDYDRYPFLRAFNGLTMNKPVAEITIEAGEVKINEAMVKALAEELKRKLNPKELKLLKSML